MINPNEAFEEELYYRYLRDPQSVSPQWREYFAEKKPSHASYGAPQKEEAPSPQKPKAKKETTEIKLKDFERPEELSSIAAIISENMEESLELPTATSVRTIPVKALDENRRIINKYLLKMKRPKVSFTHILAWSIVRALVKFPHLNAFFMEKDGKKYRVHRDSVNIGLAVDVTKKDGTRLLLVPNVKNAQNMNFSEFIESFDDLITKTRSNKINLDDLQDTTVTLTNPGMIGTTHSNPRLMKGQGMIVATGSINYPTEFLAVRPETLTNFAVSKVVTITNTYDHRIIQGAESAEFLAYMSELLMGGHRFYAQMFYTLQIPFEPVRWEVDVSHSNVEKSDKVEKGAHVMQMINAYRVRGHLLASVNPLGMEGYYYPELDPAYYSFTIWDLERVYHADDNWKKNNLPLRDIIEILRDTYCGAISYEFMHIQNPVKKEWIKKELETQRSSFDLKNSDKIATLRKIIQAEEMENFLHTKFVGHKRFSLEGAESVIIMIDKLFQAAADKHLNSIVMGMAHRGRLNVLVNNIGKPLQSVFNEFEGDIDPLSYHGSGDVKYHLGDRGTYVSKLKNEIPVILAPNPSHLELIDPVVVGMARALDNEAMDEDYQQTLPLLIHGDSAFAGQGIVAETLNLSQLEGYHTGGTIHIIINNQIGFTTTSEASRSTVYATDIAKMIQVPIIHVNGHDPEAIIAAAAFAFEYRNKFNSDVIIDLLCYRKYGHNEADEPTYTQPLMYKKIKQMPTVTETYKKQLVKAEVISEKDYNKIHKEIHSELQEAFDNRNEKQARKKFISHVKAGQSVSPYHTSISEVKIREIAESITEVPDDFNINPKVKKLLDRRKKMVASDEVHIDWAMAEALAFGSILIEGREVRFSGQDSRRGTFSQRHAVLTDMINENEYTPLNNIRERQGKLRIFDSPLSEMAIVGYEYGYSVIASNSLTLWEAQFGDFANNAVTMFDQFISCAETKWGQTSNLVVLLPHSYDGQGPEHSSARLERYLQLCSDENMIVGNFTTPANYFHALRRQMYMTSKVPMILMTPKGMLRHPMAVSPLEDFTKGEFQHIIDDVTVDKSKVKKILLSTGKLHYELKEYRDKNDIDNIALVRVEQIYPLQKGLLLEIFESYPNAKEFAWVQEEPKNQGAWMFIFNEIYELDSNIKLKYIGRKSSSATATGSAKIHIKEQQAIYEKSMKINL